MVSPVVRRKRLAAELRAIREEKSGKTADRVARALSWSPSKLARYELARTGLKPAEVARLLDYYGITEPRRAQLLQLAEDATGSGWWEDPGDQIPAEYQLYIGFEDEASAIAIWHHEVVPGLLQTEDYARQVIGSYSLIEPMAPGTIERKVNVRMRRQQVLTREPAVMLSAVLDEAVLTRRVGDEPVMRGQLTHLAELANRPNISIRILPLAGQHAVLGPAFAALGFSSPGSATIPDVVVSEQLKRILIIEDERQTYLHSLVFDALRTASLDAATSGDLVLETANHWCL